jgi:hypothetical protein
VNFPGIWNFSKFPGEFSQLFSNSLPIRCPVFLVEKPHIAQVQIRALIGRGGETIQEIFLGILVGSDIPGEYTGN